MLSPLIAVIIRVMYRKWLRVAGAIGLVGLIVDYILQPGMLSLDKIALVALCIFAIYGQGIEFLKRIGPFIVLLLFYDSFRGLTPSLDKHIVYKFMPNADKFLFGHLPTIQLQHWLWHGHVSWYDYIFTIAYMLHFVLVVALVILVWKTRESRYLEVVATYVLVAMAAFLTFLVFPAAPPWLASQHHVIPHITRITFQVWNSMGLHHIVNAYNSFSPDIVSALPSVHSAYATLFFIFVTKLYGKKWGALAAIYPLLIWFGTVYTGEHYAIDEIAGFIYAVAGYLVINWAVKRGAEAKKQSDNDNHAKKTSKKLERSLAKP
jgi:hypothetical protein